MNKDLTPLEELWTVERLAQHLLLHSDTIRRWIRDGRVSAVQLGGERAEYRIPRSEVERLSTPVARKIAPSRRRAMA